MPEPDPSNEARALWITAPGRCELRAETLPARSEGQVLIEALFGGISRGTERLIFQGRVPESEYERMRGPNPTILM